MFTNLCLVLLLLFAGSLVPKFLLEINGKCYKEVREMFGQSLFWRVARLYALFNK